MKKDISYYLKLNYPIIITRDEENGKPFYEAEIPDLPGCSAHGKTKNEALKRLEEAKELWITARLKRNLPIPEPISFDDFSGKYLLRIPPMLHMHLAQNAKKEEMSLNQYIRKNLETAVTLNQVLKKVEELSREVKQLSVKIRRVPEAGSVEWPEQPLRNSNIITNTADFGILAGLNNPIYSMREFFEKSKKIDVSETFLQQEE